MSQKKYFSPEMKIEELRKQFWKLCLQLHPDKGGDPAEFRAMKDEYDIVVGILAAGEAGRAEKENRRPWYTAAGERGLREAMAVFMNIPGVVVEICGCWLWITGETYNARQRLYEAGAKYSKQKKCWYWAHDMQRGKVRGKYNNMRKIRERFGSAVYRSNAEEKKEIAG